MKKIRKVLLLLVAMLLLCGITGSAATAGTKYIAKVSYGYLALRNAKSFNSGNEIGKLYNGDTVVYKKGTGTYWYVYSQKHKKYGYVNKNYLIKKSNYTTKTVKVNSGYLAIRNAMAFDYRNEMGKLYNGDKVRVYQKPNSTYWWVYSPKLGRYGYVNKNYLY